MLPLARVTVFSRRRDDGDADGIFARGTPMWAYALWWRCSVAIVSAVLVGCSRFKRNFTKKKAKIIHLLLHE